VHGRAAGKVEHAHLAQEPAAPDGVRQGRVHERRPQHDERGHTREPAALAEAADGDRTHSRTEEELEQRDEERGKSTDGLGEDAAVEEVGERVPEQGASLGERERVADDPPCAWQGREG